MISQPLMRSFAIAIPLLTAAVLLFQKESVNLFSSGLTLGLLFGIAQLLIAWGVYKHRI